MLNKQKLREKDKEQINKIEQESEAENTENGEMEITNNEDSEGKEKQLRLYFSLSISLVLLRTFDENFYHNMNISGDHYRSEPARST